MPQLKPLKQDFFKRVMCVVLGSNVHVEPQEAVSEFVNTMLDGINSDVVNDRLYAQLNTFTKLSQPTTIDGEGVLSWGCVGKFLEKVCCEIPNRHIQNLASLAHAIAESDKNCEYTKAITINHALHTPVSFLMVMKNAKNSNDLHGPFNSQESRLAYIRRQKRVYRA